MGHRALVAVETETGRYDVYHSQWGGSTPTDPTISADSVVTEIVESDAATDSDRAVGGVLEALDPLEYEALLVAGLNGGVEAFLVVWLGLVLADGRAPASERGGHPTALVPIRDSADGRRIRRSVRRTKEALAEAVDAGTLGPEGAIELLRARVATHPDVSRGVVFPPSP